jgi:tRNA-dihydrouridine synthase B
MDIFKVKGIADRDSLVLMLAPMEGITNSVFRRLIVDIGSVDTVATEFVRITSERQTIRPFVRHKVPLQIQLMGTDPDVLRQCVRFMYQNSLLEAGDWLDFNVGCPSRRVNSSGAGAALLKDPGRLREIVGGLREAHEGPLSVKTRLGFDEPNEFRDILNIYASCPLDFITVHARTRCGGYQAPVDHGRLREAVSTLPFPVIGNGDVFTPLDALRMAEQTGVRGIMVGRGAVQNPFIFREIRRLLTGNEALDVPSREELLRFSIELLLGSQSRSPERSVIGPFKEFGTWFSKNPQVGSGFFSAIKRITDVNELQSVIQGHFA